MSKLTAILAGLGITLSGYAIGLGDIQVQGVLNQPFHATVPLTDLGSLNPQDIKVQLATIDKYNELNIDRPGYLSRFSFTIDDSQGKHPQIVISSDVPIDDPIVNILLVVNASGTRFYREYTVFLDPNTPIYNASGMSASSSGNATVAASTVKQSSRPVSSGKVTQKGWYGPTRSNDTLWHIASNYQPNGASVEQTAVAIYQNNSAAFINNDVNKLKAGVKLRIPSTKEIKAVSPSVAQQTLSQSSSAPSSEISQPKTTEIPPLNATKTSTPGNTTTNDTVQNTTTMPSNPMVLTTPTPQEATMTVPTGGQPTAQPNAMPSNAIPSTNTLNQEEQKIKDELNYVVKSLQTEQATNQLLSTQMQDLQHRNEELQHDLSDKDALIMNLQALVNQKQQAQAPTGTSLPPTSQGGTLPPVESTGPSWGLWISLIILLAAAGAAYWQRQIVFAFILAQKKNLLEKLAKNKEEEFEEDAEEFNETEAAASVEIPLKSVEREQQKSGKVVATPTDELIKELLQTVDEYIATERYNKAELEINLFLSHYPGQVDAAIKLLEIFAITKKQKEFDRALYGFSISHPNSSQAIQDKIAALQKTDWQVTPSVDIVQSTQPLPEQENATQEIRQNEVSQELTEAMTSHDEFSSAVSSNKRFDHDFATPIEDRHSIEATPMQENKVPEITSTQENKPQETIPVQEKDSLLETKQVETPQEDGSVKDEHNIDFISGLGSGYSPVIRDIEHTDETDTTHEISEADAATPLAEDSDAMKEAVEEAPSSLVDNPKDGAKLDLSETYLSMGEYGAARKLLEEVFKSHTSSVGQKEKATQGLQHIEDLHKRNHIKGDF